MDGSVRYWVDAPEYQNKHWRRPAAIAAGLIPPGLACSTSAPEKWRSAVTWSTARTRPPILLLRSRA